MITRDLIILLFKKRNVEKVNQNLKHLHGSCIVSHSTKVVHIVIVLFLRV